MLKDFDASEYLTTPEDIAIFLDEAIQMDDPRTLVAALKAVARSQGMTELSRKAGVGRESLYKSLADDANPSIATVMKLFNALGLKMTVEAKDSEIQGHKEMVYA